MTTTHSPLHAEMKAAYLKHAPRFAALPAEKHVSMSVDAPLLFTTSHSALLSTKELQTQIAALPDIRKDRVEEAQELLLAFGYAQARYVAHQTPAEAIPALHEKTVKNRQHLATAAGALAMSGLFPNDRVVDLKRNLSREAAALDVIGMVGEFTDRWSTFEGKTALTREQLEEMLEDASDLLIAVGARRSESGSRFAHDRAASLTFFASSWDQLRRGAGYIRWEAGDVDDIYPPLHSNRVQRGPSKPKPEGDTEAPSAAPSALTPVAAVAKTGSDDDESPFIR